MEIIYAASVLTTLLKVVHSNKKTQLDVRKRGSSPCILGHVIELDIAFSEKS